MARANGRHNLHVLEQALALNAAGSAGTRSGREDADKERILNAAGYDVIRVPSDQLETAIPLMQTRTR
jgi:very-short-patch-repair endonuclease